MNEYHTVFFAYIIMITNYSTMSTKKQNEMNLNVRMMHITNYERSTVHKLVKCKKKCQQNITRNTVQCIFAWSEYQDAKIG